MAKKTSSSRRRSRTVPKKKNQIDKNVLILAGVAIIIVVAIAAFLTFGGNNVKNTDNDDNTTDNPIAVFETTKGTIKVELYKDEMPNTCDNFIKLVNDDFYDGMIFHRVMDDFMIQAGNTYPDGSTEESPYGSIDFENSDIKHEDGTISMARTNDPNSATSQFFICDGAQPSLDGNYAAFGKTIEGINVVRDIADESHDGSYGSVGGGRPNNDIIINSITIEN